MDTTPQKTRVVERFKLEDAEKHGVPRKIVSSYRHEPTGPDRVPARLEELIRLWASESLQTDDARYIQETVTADGRTKYYQAEADVLATSGSGYTVLEVKTTTYPKRSASHAFEQLAHLNKKLRNCGADTVKGCAVLLDVTRDGVAHASNFTTYDLKMMSEKWPTLYRETGAVQVTFKARDVWQWAIDRGFEESMKDLNRYSAQQESESCVARAEAHKVAQQKKWAAKKSSPENADGPVVYDVPGMACTALDRLSADDTLGGELFRRMTAGACGLDEFKDILETRAAELKKTERDLCIGFAKLGKFDELAELERSLNALSRYFNATKERSALYLDICEHLGALMFREKVRGPQKELGITVEAPAVAAAPAKAIANSR